MITTEVFIGKDRVAFTRGDGIIISTPTGSTAYSLAAGGPIIDPRCRVFMITPLCSHKLSNRSIIIPENEILTISMATKGDKTRLINDGGVRNNYKLIMESKKIPPNAYKAILLRKISTMF